MNRLLLFLVFLLALVPVVSAERSIDVLSVSETENRTGGLATVHLEVRPGSGSVYIDSYPLTRLDTQISTRFAREYACRLAGEDCSRLDFFYVLRAPTTIIGGPSAGAAMTVLTYAELSGAELDEGTVMTGTINSGGLIGPVGGVREKVVAARDDGFERVLVPAVEYDSNISVRGIEVVPVVDVEEAIWYFTGEDVRPEPGEISVPDEYRAQMESVADQLCDRAEQLRSLVDANASRDLLRRASEASARTDFYSAASFCFSANLRLQEAHLADRSGDDLRAIVRQLRVDIEEFDDSLPADVSTIADLEIYMVVRERLIEAFDVLEEQELSNVSSSSVAYALERFSSAKAWSSFFGRVPSKEVDLSQRHLRASCSQKIAEAQERVNYVRFLLDSPLEDTRRGLQNALEDQRQEEWVLCLFKASKARAEADAVITAVYAGDSLNQTVQRQRDKAQQVLAAQSREGNFPIISYAYYEYSGAVDDVYSANLYAAYALELGNLEIYFPEPSASVYVDSDRLLLLGVGLLIGFSSGVLAWELLYRRRRRSKK